MLGAVRKAHRMGRNVQLASPSACSKREPVAHDCLPIRQLTGHVDAAPHTKRNGSNCFPPASPRSRITPGKQKTPLRASAKFLFLFDKTGAGEGIRTLDPNLGKVVLYP